MIKIKNGSISKGFTLIELSAVLIVIGILLALVTAGISILNQSYITSTISDLEKMRTAVNLFEQNFKVLPGDFAKANSTLGNGVQDGNGDGKVCDSLSGTCLAIPTYITPGAGANLVEYSAFFHHLSAGDFSKISYDGSNLEIIPGVNFPKFKIDGTILPYTSNSNGVFYYHFGQFISTGGTINPPTPALLASQAFQVDLKLDDGLPSTGIVVEVNNFDTHSPAAGVNPSCHTGASAGDPDAIYSIQESELVCQLRIGR